MITSLIIKTTDRAEDYVGASSIAQHASPEGRGVGTKDRRINDARERNPRPQAFARRAQGVDLKEQPRQERYGSVPGRPNTPRITNRDRVVSDPRSSVTATRAEGDGRSGRSGYDSHRRVLSSSSTGEAHAEERAGVHTGASARHHKWGTGDTGDGGYGPENLSRHHNATPADDGTEDPPERQGRRDEEHERLALRGRSLNSERQTEGQRAAAQRLRAWQERRRRGERGDAGDVREEGMGRAGGREEGRRREVRAVRNYNLRED